MEGEGMEGREKEGEGMEGREGEDKEGRRNPQPDLMEELLPNVFKHHTPS